MKGWFQRFMSGRYGFDRFSGFLSTCSLIFIVLGALFVPFLYFLGLLLLIYCYFRILSRNIQKRYQENLKYLALEGKVTGWFATRKIRFQQRKEYHYYRCPPLRSAAARTARAGQNLHYLPEMRHTVH